MNDFYSSGARTLQDRFDARRLADKETRLIVHHEITDADRAFIQGRDMFFLATVDREGRPQCSYKGGAPGFVKVVDEQTIAFPCYDGNSMFLSMGNILDNSRVGLLFIDFEDPRRLRLNGTATLHADDVLLPEYHEAQFIVRVHVEACSSIAPGTYTASGNWRIRRSCLRPVAKLPYRPGKDCLESRTCCPLATSRRSGKSTNNIDSSGRPAIRRRGNSSRLTLRMRGVLRPVLLPRDSRAPALRNSSCSSPLSPNTR